MMTLTSEKGPCRQPLAEGLTLRTSADETDIQRVAEFNGIIHGPDIVPMSYNLFMHHPHMEARDIVFVEDEGRIVSSLCLIPWSLNYEDASLQAGEMGIVGTLEAYRHRGLIRAQIQYFKQRLNERGCVLSHIQGIPYYYRQFGYEYALPLEGGLRLETRHILLGDKEFTFRLAAQADVPLLMRLYDDAAEELALHAVRSEAVWRYLMTHTEGTDTACETWIIEDASGQPVGYLRLPEHHFGDELTVNEVSRLQFDAALAALNHLKALNEERGTPGIRLNLPDDCTLMRLASSLGAFDAGQYAWQVHIPSIPALLVAIKPALEARIARSPFAGLNQVVRLGFYRETVTLQFENGRLVDVAALGFTEGEEIQIPPFVFTPLVLGYRTREELRTNYPDVSISPRWRLLVDVLFPKMQSFLHPIY